MPPRILHLIFLAVLIIPHHSGLTSSLQFDFSSLTLGELKLLGDAHLKNGSIRLSRELPVPTSGSGRALFASPVPLHLPFSTSFSFSVQNLNPSSTGGGLAFLLSPDSLSLGDPGPFLGLLSPSPSPSPPLFAVEFDTLMDLQFSDPNDNHVGLDLNSMLSSQSADLASSSSVFLKSGRPVHAWIDYSLSPLLLQVFVSHSPSKPPSPVLSLPLSLPHLLLSDSAFAGFSASTQGSTEIHTIDSWSFSSSSSSSPSHPPAPTPAATDIINIIKPRPPPRAALAAALAAAAAAAFLIAACAALPFIYFRRRRRRAEIVLKAPREFSYRELHAATRGFPPSRIIGHGAFGTVYKGILRATGAFVAVKRCANPNAPHARSDLLSELSIISTLRHRHLLPLLGWCHHRSEILLVYDYMPHGSLDKALFHSPSPLPWPHRRKILLGVASALSYLHHECDRQVIHRDVKSSNVLLDQAFLPRLGDFGLARQIDHDRSPDPTATAGTMGYLAPEYLLTGRADDKTDVYSFGALVLEVASGRRPIDDSRRGSLVEWVWGLHAQGRLLEAVDARMEDAEDSACRRVLLVGLGCSSPDPAARPGMRSVVQMLGDEADPPHVPPAKPAVTFSDNQQLLLSLQDSVSDYNAAVDGLPRFSSSSSSSSCSLASVVVGGG